MLENIEFVVNMAVPKVDGTTQTLSYALSSYDSDETSTAYSKMRQAVLSDASVHDTVHWVAVGFMLVRQDATADANGQLVSAMRGTIDWFRGIQWFRKHIGDQTGVESAPVSCGFIDNTHSVRVEIENGTVWLSHV